MRGENGTGLLRLRRLRKREDMSRKTLCTAIVCLAAVVLVTLLAGTALGAGAGQTSVDSSASAPVVTAISPASGPSTGGTSVTISGTNFSPRGAVMFGTVPVPFRYDSPTQITAIAPAQAAGTVDVVITRPGGTSPVVAADHYTYSGPMGAGGAPVNAAVTTPPAGAARHGVNYSQTNVGWAVFFRQLSNYLKII